MPQQPVQSLAERAFLASWFFLSETVGLRGYESRLLNTPMIGRFKGGSRNYFPLQVEYSIPSYHLIFPAETESKVFALHRLSDIFAIELPRPRRPKGGTIVGRGGALSLA